MPGRLTEAVRLIGPAGMLTLVFTWAHGHLFHDVYQGYGRLDYRLAPPRQLLQQWLFAFNHVLLSFHRDPVLLPQLPPLLQAVRFLVERFLALPLFMGGLAWWRKDRTLGLGLLWVFASLVPVAWLVGGHTARFYYLPAVGSALIVAHGMECCWQASVRWKARPERPRIQLLARSTQVGVTLGLVYLLIVNLSMITLSALRYHEESDLIFAAYSTLRKQSGQIPRGSLLVMRNIPASLFVNGIGLPDMVRVALGDPTAQAAIEGEILPYNWLARLHRIPTQFVMDFSVQPLTIQSLTRLSTGGAAARAFPRANTAPALIEPQVRIRA